MIEIEVRNPTDAAPELLRLLVSKGHHEGERIIVEEPVLLTYREPHERVIGWLDWPDSPLDVFCEAVSAISISSEGPIQTPGMAVQHNVSSVDVQCLLGKLTTQLSLGWEIYYTRWQSPMRRLTLEVHGLTCRKMLLKEAGALLLEISTTQSYPDQVPVTQDTVSDLKMFTDEGLNAIGYKSPFVRKVVIPMYRAEAAARAEGLHAALPILLRSQQTDWIGIARQWIEHRL